MDSKQDGDFLHRIRDGCLYRYRPFSTEEDIERCKSIVFDNLLYFCSPSQLNDPFECRACFSYDSEKEQREFIERGLKEKRPELTESQREQVLDDFMKRNQFGKLPANLTDYIDVFASFSTCCFSERRDCLLMWSHYAGAHTGLCLEFCIPASDAYLRNIRMVTYELNYPVYNYFIDRRWALKASLTKSEVWEYEKEWRIIEPFKGPGQFQFEPNMLKGVIFGCRMPEEGKMVIREWNKRRIPKLKLYQAELEERKYGLKIVEAE